MYITIIADKCASSPCQNHGTCTYDLTKYTCTCVAGYKGINCESGRLVYFKDIVSVQIFAKLHCIVICSQCIEYTDIMC